MELRGASLTLAHSSNIKKNASILFCILLVELRPGFEPGTSSLPWMRSTY